MISVERKIVSFGVRALDTGVFADGPGAFGGIPSPSFLDAGCANVPNDGTLGAQNTLHETAIQILAPGRRHTDGPITAIAIAGDSPIATVNLIIDGIVHRISPERPFVGTVADHQAVSVVPARSTPALFRFPSAAPTYAAYQRWVVPWDMSTIEKIAAGTFGPEGDTPTPKPIVKLDLYRGGAVFPPTHRASYHAELDFEIVDEGAFAVGTTSNPALIAIVDGRRRIRVTASKLPVAGGGVACHLEINGIESRKSTNEADGAGLTTPRVDVPTFDELLAKTAITDQPGCLVFDYEGNPYYAILIRVLSDTQDADTLNTDGIGAKGYITLEAWDS
jgi:hypothetical protein